MIALSTTQREALDFFDDLIKQVRENVQEGLHILEESERAPWIHLWGEVYQASCHVRKNFPPEDREDFVVSLITCRLKVCTLRRFLEHEVISPMEDSELKNEFYHIFHMIGDLAGDLCKPFIKWEKSRMATKKKTEKVTYDCPMCEKTYKTERGFKSHMEREHPDDVERPDEGFKTIKAAVYNLFEQKGVSEVTVEESTAAARKVKPDTKFNKHHLYYWRKQWRDLQAEKEED